MFDTWGHYTTRLISNQCVVCISQVQCFIVDCGKLKLSFNTISIILIHECFRLSRYDEGMRMASKGFLLFYVTYLFACVLHSRILAVLGN